MLCDRDGTYSQQLQSKHKGCIKHGCSLGDITRMFLKSCREAQGVVALAVANLAVLPLPPSRLKPNWARTWGMGGVEAG